MVAWCSCWGKCQLFLNLCTARPPNTTHVSVRGIRAGEVIYPGYPGCACPAVVNSARADLRTVWWYRAHARYIIAQGPSVRIHRASRHALGASALKSKPDGTPVSGYLTVGFAAGEGATYFLPPCWRITAAASLATEYSATANGVCPSLSFAFTAAPLPSNSVAVSTALSMAA